MSCCVFQFRIPIAKEEFDIPGSLFIFIYVYRVFAFVF